MTETMILNSVIRYRMHVLVADTLRMSPQKPGSRCGSNFIRTIRKKIRLVTSNPSVPSDMPFHQSRVDAHSQRRMA